MAIVASINTSGPLVSGSLATGHNGKFELPSYEDNWALWRYIDDAPPCRCCSIMSAIDDGMWHCASSGRRWLLLDEPLDLTQPHHEGLCKGNCRFHPMNNADMARWQRGMLAGLGWGDLWAEEEALRESRLSAEAKAARDAAREAALLEQERKDAIERETRERERKADRVAIRVGVFCKQKAQKVHQPCKFLYNCQGTPARPTTRRVTTECWSYEYTDPVTGKRMAPHVCDRMHPGEPGWCAEWDGNPSYKPETFRHFPDEKSNTFRRF